MFIGRETIDEALKYIEELEEAKRITELTKISCCTEQNCGALENAIRKDLENNRLKEQLEMIREKLEIIINKLEKVDFGGWADEIRDTFCEILEGEENERDKI